MLNILRYDDVVRTMVLVIILTVLFCTADMERSNTRQNAGFIKAYAPQVSEGIGNKGMLLSNIKLELEIRPLYNGKVVLKKI